MAMPDGVLSVVNSGKECEFEWKINNFLPRKYCYMSPDFKFESECWQLDLNELLTRDIHDRYMALRLRRSSLGSPIEVEFSVSVKTTKGAKNFERRGRYCFKGLCGYDIVKYINLNEFTNREREFLSSGCLTILITMQKAQYEKETQSASAAAASFIKDCHQGDKISLECRTSNAKVASVAEVCSCCKEIRHGESLQKIPVHKKCLDQPIMCPKCAEIVSWQNWFGHECQAANVKSVTGTGESSTICEHDKILQDLRQLSLNHEHSDVIFRVKGKEFPAHKAILAVRSPVFASTFRHEMKENKTGIVDIEDCDPAVFPDFLRFLYSHDTDNLSGENVFDLFRIADKYDCQDLRAKCMHFIKHNLTVETFCKALSLALLHSEAELLRLATDFFIVNAETILVTVEWQTFAAENLTYCNELFIKYVKSTKRSNK